MHIQIFTSLAITHTHTIHSCVRDCVSLYIFFLALKLACVLIHLGDKLWQPRRHLNWNTEGRYHNIASPNSECGRDEFGQIQLLAVKRHCGQHTGPRSKRWVRCFLEIIISECVRATVCLFNGHTRVSREEITSYLSYGGGEKPVDLLSTTTTTLLENCRVLVQC
jgi:hypothetical protein